MLPGTVITLLLQCYTHALLALSDIIFHLGFKCNNTCVIQPASTV